MTWTRQGILSRLAPFYACLVEILSPAHRDFTIKTIRGPFANSSSSVRQIALPQHGSQSFEAIFCWRFEGKLHIRIAGSESYSGYNVVTPSRFFDGVTNSWKEDRTVVCIWTHYRYPLEASRYEHRCPHSIVQFRACKVLAWKLFSIFSNLFHIVPLFSQIMYSGFP